MTTGIPTVTVMMLVKDRANLLGLAAASILTQEAGEDLELLILDDGSVDGTWTVAQRLAEADPRVRLLRNERSVGIPHARNQALAAANGQLLAIADSDDLSRPARLRLQRAAMAADPELVGVGSEISAFAEDPAEGTAPPWHWGLADGRLPFAFPTALLRTDAVRDCGGFDPSLPVAEDLDLCYRLWQAGATFCRLPEPLVDYRIHAGSITVRREWLRHTCTLRVHLRAAFRYRCRLTLRGWLVLCQSILRCAGYPLAIGVRIATRRGGAT